MLHVPLYHDRPDVIAIQYFDIDKKTDDREERREREGRRITLSGRNTRAI